MAITFARTSQVISSVGEMGISASIPFPNITASSNQFTIPDFTGTITSWTYNSDSWLNCAWQQYAHFEADVYIDGKKSNAAIGFTNYNDLKIGISTSWASKAWTDTKGYTYPLNTSDYFNASNKTSKTLPITLRNPRWTLQNEVGEDFSKSATTTGTGTAVLTLNAPPTCSYTQVQSDTGDRFFRNRTTAKVTLSNLSAKYGGDITEAKLTIGSQTAARTTNGDLTIKLNATGTFTPVLSLRDSRGQITTYNLSAITVKSVPIYAKTEGAWKLVLPKVKASGSWKEPKGIYVKQDGAWKKLM